MTNISICCFQFHFVSIHRCLMWHTSRKKLPLRYNVALDKIFVTDGSMKTSEISVASWKRDIPSLGQSKQLGNFFSFKTSVSQGRAIGVGIKEVKRQSERKQEHLFSLMLSFFSLTLVHSFSLLTETVGYGLLLSKVWNDLNLWKESIWNYVNGCRFPSRSSGEKKTHVVLGL